MIKSNFARCLFTGLLSLASVFSTHVPAQQLSAPYTGPGDTGKVRAYLETEFNVLTNGCGITSLTTAKVEGNRIKNGTQISAVPITLQRDISNFDRAVPAVFDRSPAAIFSLIFLDSERKTVIANAPNYPFFDERRFLSQDYLQDPVTMLPNGASSVFYNHTCSSIVNAALNSKSGITFPIATLSAAIQDQYGSNTQTILSLVEGHFTSPLNAYFGGGADFAHQNYGQLLLWEWYQANADRATQPNFWLTAIDGLALYRSSLDKRSNNGSGTLSGKIDLPVFEADTALKATIANASDFVVNKYKFIPYTEGNATAEWGHFEKIPQANDIVGYFKSIHTTPEPFTQVVEQNVHDPYLITQDLDGVPPSYCASSGRWSVVDTSSAPGALYSVTMAAVSTTGLTSTGKISVASPTGCKLSVNFSPKPSFFLSASATLSMSYIYAPPPGSPLDKLTISATPMNLNTSVSPDLHLIKLGSVAKPSADKDPAGRDVQVLTWTEQILVNDKEDPVDPTGNIDTTGGPNPKGMISISCENYTPNIGLPTATYVAGNGQRIVNLTISRTVESFDKEDLTGPTMKCDVNGTLGFPMASPLNSGRVVYKALPNIEIQYPVLKPANPAPTNPAPTNPAPTNPAPTNPAHPGALK